MICKKNVRGVGNASFLTMLAIVDYDRSTALNLVDSLTRDGDDIWTRENCFRAEASLSFLNSGVLNKEAENHLLS